MVRILSYSYCTLLNAFCICYCYKMYPNLSSVIRLVSTVSVHLQLPANLLCNVFDIFMCGCTLGLPFSVIILVVKFGPFLRCKKVESGSSFYVNSINHFFNIQTNFRWISVGDKQIKWSSWCWYKITLYPFQLKVHFEWRI